MLIKLMTLRKDICKIQFLKFSAGGNLALPREPDGRLDIVVFIIAEDT